MAKRSGAQCRHLMIVKWRGLGDNPPEWLPLLTFLRLVAIIVTGSPKPGSTMRDGPLLPETKPRLKSTPKAISADRKCLWWGLFPPKGFGSLCNAA